MEFNIHILNFSRIQMNSLKLLFAFLTVSSVTVNADLIGYNRLGNNVNGHVLSKKTKKNSYKNYMKQLHNFINENPSKSSSKKTQKFLKSKKKNFARRKFYSAMMSSLYLNI